MLLTDLNGPMSLQPRFTGAGRISHAALFTASAILFLSFATVGANVSRAQEQQTSQSQQDQSVAEAARQERARKQEKQKTAKHVYTEEDLKRANILTPEDRELIEAKKTECAQKNNCSPAPSQNPPATLDANSPATGTPADSGISLGEVARQLRGQKELQALKPKQTEPFHLPVDAPALASPVLPGLPALQPSAQPARPKISSPKLYSPRIPSPKISAPKAPANIFRRDPFSGMPARPEFRQPEVARPEIRQPETRSTEVHPTIRETVRPIINGDVHPKLPTSVHPKVSAGVAPKISGSVPPEVGKNLVPSLPPTSVRPDFSQAVRPTLRAPRQIVTNQPKISTPVATPDVLIQPTQPPAPSKPRQSVMATAPVRPVVPAAKSAQPAAPVINSMSPVAPVSTIRPVAPPAVAVPVQPVATQRTVNVRRGDSLWKLAQQNLGRGNRWPELAAANPDIVDPNQIRAGAQLNLPVVTAADARRGAKSDSGSTIKVRKGDSLWTLAKSNLGRASAWPCLAAANSLVTPDRIFEGQRLAIPAACSGPVN
jgi:LysM repeat protein